VRILLRNTRERIKHFGIASSFFFAFYDKKNSKSVKKKWSNEVKTYLYNIYKYFLLEKKRNRLLVSIIDHIFYVLQKL